MKNRFLNVVVCAMLVFSPMAFATGNGSGNNNGNNPNNANANASASAVAGAKADSKSVSGSVATGGQSSVDNNVNVVVEGDNIPEQDYPVHTATSASLTSGFDTCMGSGSAGLQLSGIGVTGGKTYVDKNCILIKQVQLLRQLGLYEAACERARLGEEGAAIREAMEIAGTDCKVFNNPTPSTAVAPPVDMSKYATIEQLNRAFEVSQRKSK